jgi:putative ABC transport system substrate-binding protein
VKGLELLKDAIPSLRRVAVLSNPANPAHPLMLKNVAGVARTLGIELHVLEVRGPDEFEPAFAAMAQQHAAAVMVVPDYLSVAHADRLAELALEYRLPSIYGFRENVQSGGLMSYGPDFSEPFRRAATFVDRLLKGASPAELPVEQPTKFELVINLRTAKALGIEISAGLLARADEVID